MTRAPDSRTTTLPSGERTGVPTVDLSPAALSLLHRFVRRYVANPADAADIEQQTLLIACGERGRVHVEHTSRWLLTVARHLIVDHYRFQGRLRFVTVVSALVERQPELQTRPDVALAIAESRERLRHVLDRVCRRIRLEQQVAVLLSDVYGYGNRDSAVLLHMSVPSFKLLLHGARARLWGSRARANGGAHNGKGGYDSAHRLGVTCHIPPPDLLAIRERLLRGLDPRPSLSPPSGTRRTSCS